MLRMKYQKRSHPSCNFAYSSKKSQNFSTYFAHQKSRFHYWFFENFMIRFDLIKWRRHMTKSQLINIIAKKAHLTKRASEEAVEAIFDEIIRSLRKGDKVVISGFG